MARKNVNILLKLEDKFTRPMVQAGKITEEQQRALYKCSSQVVKFSRSMRSSFASAAGHALKLTTALAGISGVLSIAGLKSFASDAAELAKAQIEAETKLEAVLGNVQSLASQGPEAIKQAKEELVGVARGLQKVGVIGDEVTLAGMQQLATFQLSTEQITTLSKGMTDLLAQQKGLNATQEDAVSYANLIGKAMNGNAGALTRVGIIMDANQKKMLETGDATQRAAVLAEILQQNVGGVNEALADTDQGRLQQFANQWGDMKEEVGKHIIAIKATLAKNFAEYIPKIQELAVAAVQKISGAATRAVEWVKSHSEEIKAAIISVKDGLLSVWKAIKPVLTFAIQHAKTLIPAIIGVTGAISGISIVSDIATKVSLFAEKFMKLRDSIAKAGGLLKWLPGGPITLIIAGIAAAVAAVVYLWNHCEGFRNFIKKAAEVIVTAWNRIKDTAVRVKDGAVAAFQKLATVVSTIFNTIKQAIGKVMDWIEDKIQAVKDAIERIKQTWQDLQQGSWLGANETGYVKQSELGAHATGTPYFAGGATRINEGGRGEIVTLPSGTQIIPHDIARNSTSKVIQPIININVAGSVATERELFEKSAAYLTSRLKLALSTV